MKNRVLIIHINRCGSTRLANSLAKVLGVKHYPSPFRPHILNQPKENSFYFENPCVLQVENPCVFQGKITNGCDSRHKELIKGFKNVILLSRRNLDEAIKSWAYTSYCLSQENSNFKSHTSRYVWEETPNYEVSKNILNWANNRLEKLSNEFNIPITYYEDLYYDSPVETVNKFNLDIDAEYFVKKYLNTDLRQRVNINSQNIL